MLASGQPRVSSSDTRGSAARVGVTALVTTHNHAQFIEQAVESALAQQVEGRYEILIADDFSTDGTREIVRGYAEQYAEVIRLLLPGRNLGANAIRARGAQAARGAYVALLDGDDYWTSPHKLRKQVDFFDRHPQHAICFHNATVVYEDGREEPHPFHSQNPTRRLSRPVPPETSTLEDIAAGNFMLTCSVMFRNGLVDEFPKWYFQASVDDWAFHVLNAEHGHIGYIDEILCAYRVHGRGAWSDRISHYRNPNDLADIIWVHDSINRHLGFRYDARIKEKTAYLAARAAALLAEEGRLEEAAAQARRSLADAPNLKGVRGRMRLEVLARPRLARLRSSTPVAVAAAPARRLRSRARRAAAVVKRVGARYLP